MAEMFSLVNTMKKCHVKINAKHFLEGELFPVKFIGDQSLQY